MATGMTRATDGGMPAWTVWATWARSIGSAARDEVRPQVLMVHQGEMGTIRLQVGFSKIQFGIKSEEDWEGWMVWKAGDSVKARWTEGIFEDRH